MLPSMVFGSSPGTWYGTMPNIELNEFPGRIRDFADFLNPGLKDKIVVTYPNDDDAVLYAFDLM